MTHDWALKLVDTQPGVLLHEDVALIQELVGKLPQARSVKVVALGPGNGAVTLSALCARPEKVSITTIAPDAETLRWAGALATNIGRHGDCLFELSEPADAASLFKAETVDLLLIDGGLSYSAAKHELTVWLPKVAKDGYVWFHNYGDPYKFGWSAAPSPGIKRAIEEAIVAEDLELVEVKGLGWAGRKPTPRRPQYAPKKGEKRT